MSPFSRSALVVALTALTGSALADSSFTPLGDLPGGSFASFARGVSADGLTVIGMSDSGTGPQAFLWTASGGMVGLGAGAIDATGVSADGSVVVGLTQSYGFRWTIFGDVYLIGWAPGSHTGSARAVSADGRTIVGDRRFTGATGTYDHGFHWTNPFSSDSVTTASSNFYSRAFGVSADGAVVVGTRGGVPGSSGTGGVAPKAYRWTIAGGTVLLPSIPNHTTSDAFGVSGDGSVIVGISRSPSEAQAFRWTSAGIVGLGDLPGGPISSRATAVTTNGQYIVGSGTTADGRRAFIYDSVNGMRDLQEVLVLQGLGTQVAGWTLNEATAVAVSVSGDIIIAGSGTDPLGRNHAFSASISTTGPGPEALHLGDAVSLLHL